MSAELLGCLEEAVRSAGRVRGTHRKTSADSQGASGGANAVTRADFWQLHPVTSNFLASNPLDAPSSRARHALEMFLEDGGLGARSFWQLTKLMRRDDKWWNSFLGQCRIGNLPMEDSGYFHGFPA